jgi:hypothetical protein
VQGPDFWPTSYTYIQKGKHNRSLKVEVQGPDFWPTPYTYIQKGKHNRSLKVEVQGPDFMAHPLYIHTYMIVYPKDSEQELILEQSDSKLLTSAKRTLVLSP